MADKYNIIVVGAGWFGLAAAKTYLELHPGEKMLVLESANSCGGTWSQDRLYPGLKSNNLWGSYEYPDFPMTAEKYGLKEGVHIPAAVLHQYLTDYAKAFGVFERIRFGTTVNAIQATAAGGWRLDVSSASSSAAPSAAQTLETDKVIIATGLTSLPNLPTYAGQETFTPPLFHARDFYRHAETVDSARTAVVVGCGKSAYDSAYAYATGGAEQVHLIVRPSGQGPVWLCPPYVTPFKRKLEELLHTRCLTWFSPCPWGSEDGFGPARSFLHGTGLGRLLVDNYWNTMSNDVVELNGFNDNARLFKLRPWNGAVWMASSVGIHNYPTSLWDLVSQGRIVVHHADITRLEGETVHLSSGEAVRTDVLLCATGWKKDQTMRQLGFDMGLALAEADQERLADKYDKEILTMFPMLKSQPVLRSERAKADPLRLYRFMVPPTMVVRRNIAFAGFVSTVSTANFATAQALWISAFLDGRLKRVAKTDDEITSEVMLHTQFGKWRYPCGYGSTLPDFAFDSLPYMDLLLNDLGLKNHRKPTQISELFEPYKPKDYQGLTREWIEAQENGTKS